MEASKRFQMQHNVILRVLDAHTGRMIREQRGHNSATNTMVMGIGNYLIGNGVLHQGPSMLGDYVPRYISLGTMGLLNQEEDGQHLPVGIDYDNYIAQRPGYGCDGYNLAYMNGRTYAGLGPAFTSFSITKSYYKNDIVYYRGLAYRAKVDMIIDPESGTYNYWDSDKNWELLPDSQQPTFWELITTSSPRAEISFRDVVPENEAEMPKSVDVIFSAMISTNALQEFRADDKDYVFITEAGLWSEREFVYLKNNVGRNNLLAAYRIVPPNKDNWDMSDTSNRELLQKEILRVERDQVVQVIWKIQIGNYDDIESYNS